MGSVARVRSFSSLVTRSVCGPGKAHVKSQLDTQRSERCPSEEVAGRLGANKAAPSAAKRKKKQGSNRSSCLIGMFQDSKDTVNQAMLDNNQHESRCSSTHSAETCLPESVLIRMGSKTLPEKPRGRQSRRT